LSGGEQTPLWIDALAAASAPASEVRTVTSEPRSASSIEADPVCVWISGDMDLASAPRCADRIAEALRAQPSGLALDLSGVAFIDSTGLGVLIGTRNDCLERGISLELRAPSEPVGRLLAITGLSSAFGLPGS
jgi:anti-sigma B factor antagonist